MTVRNLIQLNRVRLPVVASCLVVMLTACGSVPKPVAQMSAAETALNAADNKEAARHAPVPMDRARQKLSKAKQAMASEQYEKARRLAEEAQADAELAQALTDQQQAQAAVKQLEAGVDALRSEIERSENR